MGILALHRVLAFLITHSTLLGIIFAYPTNEAIDIQALLEFKSKITSDPLHVMESWNESTPLCQWYGVTCGSRHKRVQKLYLNSSKITGTISPYIGNLSFLRELFLQNNNFIGNIPPEIGRLQRLRFLWLYNNTLIGSIPSNISNCYNLNEINFRGNHLDGEIPAELGSFPKLTSLELRRNSFYGKIPSSLGNLSTLGILSASENRLIGTLPDTIGQLRKLVTFRVASNRLSGSVPLSLFNFSSLSVFEISDNMFHGSLPPNLFNTLSNLQYFFVWRNNMTGEVPISLPNASNLLYFETNGNEFTGKLPSFENLHKLTTLLLSYNHYGKGASDDLEFLCSLTNNTNFKMLWASHNNFGGTIPKCIGNFSSIVQLSLGINAISGPIPTEVGNLINLEALELVENQLSSEIPSSIGNLVNLVTLNVHGNKLSGNIPSSLGNLKKLIKLSLGNNNLQDIIPHTLGGCKSLNYLYLHENDLIGSIPLEIFQISSLLDVRMYRNHLLGPLPELVGNLENLFWLDISENMLSQSIPSSLGKCVSLQGLLVQGNFFEGMIPPSLGSLRAIIVIDLSRNNLSGQIPRSLASLMVLEDLNLSYNNLEGVVPKDGVFKNISRFSIIGNNKLCGGIPELALQGCNMEKSHKKASHTTVKVVLGVLGGLLGIFALICLLLLWWLRAKRNIVSQNSSRDPLLRLSYQSLLKATNGFSSNNKLGSGSFGSVFKAILDTSQTIVAVKVFDLQRYGASRSFLAECEVLKQIRHRNLVKILTACSGIDFSGNDFKALVFEFMPNGSLEDWLHPFPTKESTSQTQKHLGLIQRLNIAIDVACALDYLHNQCELPIIHCDIKPSNVLLDDEMIGHVGDFGLSKILLDASNNSTKGQTSSSNFKGSIGYIAPEYGMGTSVSAQGDIYSYGILLLEMFSGKRPNDDVFHGSTNLNCFVKTALPDKAAKIVDPTLFIEIEELSNAGKPILDYLITIFEIGVSCSANLPKERKSMRDVVAELQFVRKEILVNGSNRPR